MTPDEIKAATTAFFGAEECDQKRYFVLSDEDIRLFRIRNNVQRPSGYGFRIHDMLTTCAVLRVQIDQKDAEIAHLKSLLPRETAEGGPT